MKKLQIILGILLIGALSLYFLQQSDWLDQFNEERNADFQQAFSEGEGFGQGHDQAQCLQQTLQQFDGCNGFECTVYHGRYLRGCLNTAAQSQDFCKDVPEFRDTPTEDDKSWAKFYCIERNIRGEGCRLLMRQQQKYCSDLGSLDK